MMFLINNRLKPLNNNYKDLLGYIIRNKIITTLEEH